MITNSSQLKRMLLGSLILLLGFSMSAQNYKQNNRFSPHFQVGINAGTSVFFGDIKQKPFWPSSTAELNELKFGGGLNVNYQFTPAIGIRLNGMYGQLAGMRADKDLYFNSNYWETNINTTFNFNNIFGKSRADRFLNFYGTFGVGLSQYTTILKTMSENVTVRTVGVEKGSGIKGRTLQGIMLYGFGFDFRINGRFNIQLESTNRVMDSDMLDAFQGGYPLDTYNYTSLGFTYKFGFNNRRIEDEDVKEVERVHALYEEYLEAQEAAKLESIVIPVIVSEDIVEEVVEETPSIPEPIRPKLEYRVQILAKFKGQLTVKQISTDYLIPMYELNEEMYQGHYIYTVGSFENYEEARRKRDELRRLFDITDAFVVSFMDGERMDQIPEAIK